MSTKNAKKLKWGEIRGSNPCMPEPQSGVLTTSPIPPYVQYFTKNKFRFQV